MAASTEPNKLRIPGESTTNPSFAAPQIQTAPDVTKSLQVAGIPAVHATPDAGTTPTAPGSASPAPTSPTTPKAPPAAGPETTNQGVPSGAPGAGGTPTVPTSTGAPPGVPNTAPPPPAVVMPPAPAPPKTMEGRNAAETAWLTAKAENEQKLYEAALGYNGGPTSALAEDQLKATEDTRTATDTRGAAGTINSSLFGEDKGRIATAKATADTKAYNVYQAAVTEANDALSKAYAAYQQAGENERREIAEAAERREAKEAAARTAAMGAPPTIVPAGTHIPGAVNPQPPGPAPPGMEWTPSGKGGWVPKGTKVVRTY